VETTVPRRRGRPDNTPVILEGVIDRWPALHRWTPDFWTARFGGRVVSTDEGRFAVADIVERAVASTDESPSPYLRSEALDDFEGLQADVEPYPDVCAPNWYRGAPFRLWNPFAGAGNVMRGRYELFIGGRGRAFPYVHFDAPGTDTFIHQVQGRKRFLLFSPEQADRLYAGGGAEFHLSAIRDPEHVSLDRFPKFGGAQATVAELGPGDTLFIPGGWWHFARMESFSVTVAVDVLNRRSWPHVIAFMSRKRRHGAVSRRAMVWLRVIGLAHGVW
jgi:histone arginine demethylase JMJD6